MLNFLYGILALAVIFGVVLMCVFLVIEIINVIKDWKDGY